MRVARRAASETSLTELAIMPGKMRPTLIVRIATATKVSSTVKLSRAVTTTGTSHATVATRTADPTVALGLNRMILDAPP